jgi:hypothetical protein
MKALNQFGTITMFLKNTGALKKKTVLKTAVVENVGLKLFVAAAEFFPTML